PRDEEVSAPVLLPAGLGFLRAERLFFPFAHDGEPGRRHAEVGEVVLHSRRAARSEREVVLRAAARVAVALDGHLRARPALHPVGVLLQPPARIVADFGLVEIEVDVGELARQLVERLAREDFVVAQRPRCGRRRRRRWLRRPRWCHRRGGRRCRWRRRRRRGNFFVATGCRDRNHAAQRTDENESTKTSHQITLLKRRSRQSIQCAPWTICCAQRRALNRVTFGSGGSAGSSRRSFVTRSITIRTPASSTAGAARARISSSWGATASRTVST